MTATFLTAEQERQLAQLVAVYPVADELGRRFADAGYELYLVGGSVRDTLLCGSAEDLDFATSARPAVTERILDGWADQVWLTGARFGTVSARKGQLRLELTTFRAERYAHGSRHPEVEFGSDIEGDLARRDFTINAMAVRLPEHRFADPFGGLADLRNRLLRTPVDSERSFDDDPLRMIRLARFSAVLEFAADPAAVRAATAMSARLDRPRPVSRERIRDELSKLVCARGHARGMDLLCDTGLAERFLPEVPALRMERDPVHHHKDVYAHTLEVVERCPRDDLMLRLAALLHDIGKPATREFVPPDRVTFHHHEVVGARMARERLKELRYPNDVVGQVSHLVALHLRFHGYDDDLWSDSAVRRYVNDAGGPLQLRRLNQLTRADVTTQNRRKAERLAAAMDDLEQRIERLREQEELDRIRPAIDGNAIMEHLGIGPGPAVGRAWHMLKEARLELGPMDASTAYRLLDEWAAREGIGP